MQAVSELPRPNRDTMAFLILHLQKVGDSTVCKMSPDNLAIVMGPTFVGYSTSDPMCLMSEAELVKAVMRSLISISSDYWANFLQYEQENLFPRFAPGTPEADHQFSRPPLPIGSTGGIAKRTRSRQLHRKPHLFQSGPLLFQSPLLN
jgi:Rac GTPase-activating protein 1